MRARVCPGAGGPGEPRRWWRMVAVTSVVILGGGPGGYEAALVAAQLGAEVTVVDRDGAGGSAVLTDCVPSKTLVATAEVMSTTTEADELGVRVPESAVRVDLGTVDGRVLRLARAQSADIRASVEHAGVRWVEGVGRLTKESSVVVELPGGEEEPLEADVVLVA